jgi:hypothetical protein
VDSEVKRRLFCIAGSDLKKKINQICTRTAGIAPAEIESIAPEQLTLLNHGCHPDFDASKILGNSLKRSQESDVASVVAVIIDATSESAAIANLVCCCPETVFAAGRHSFQKFKQDQKFPDRLDDVQHGSKALRLLALAIMLSRSGFLCLLCLNRKDVHFEASHPLQSPLTAAANSKSLGFRFVLDDSPELAMETAIRSVNSLQCVGGKAFSTPSSSRAASLVLEPFPHYVEQWEAEEFEEDEVIEAVRAKFLRLPKVNDLPPKEQEVLLRSATLARLLATRSFEHHGCNATIVLADHTQISDLTNKTGGLLGREIFNFNTNSRPTWFHLADPWLRDDGIETALSSSSVLLVDVHTGRVLGVREINSQSNTRFEMLNQLTVSAGHQPVFAIAALETGYVEIHHQGELAFWYDRYRWRHDPFGQMRRRIQEACVLACDSEKQNLEKICAAISILMDAQESSILVFILPEHEESLDSLFDPMRRALGLQQESGLQTGADDANKGVAVRTQQEYPPRATFTGGPIQGFLANTLASVFRLDGAHIISNGRIIRFAERIVLPVEEKRHGDPDDGGTGRKAAQHVAESIPGAVVVKVSASGELRVYYRPDPHRRPQAGPFQKLSQPNAETLPAALADTNSLEIP